jgi:hypothetical protein
MANTEGKITCEQQTILLSQHKMDVLKWSLGVLAVLKVSVCNALFTVK